MMPRSRRPLHHLERPRVWRLGRPAGRLLMIVASLLMMAGLAGCAFPGSARVLRTTPTPTMPRFGSVTQFLLPPGAEGAQYLTRGPDGDIWFTDAGVCNASNACAGFHDFSDIGRITPAGKFTMYPLPSVYDNPDGITLGGDGNLWFAVPGTNAVGRITPSGAITEFAVPPNRTIPAGDQPMSQPRNITWGADGNLWFPDLGYTRIARMSPTGSMVEFDLPYHGGNNAAFGITAGPDGNVWFTDGYGVGRITPSGAITEFKSPTPYSMLDITTGPDGNLWVVEGYLGTIGRITPQGAITEFPVPRGGSVCHDSKTATDACFLGSLTAGPDGNIWVSETDANALVRVTPSGVTTAFALPRDPGVPEQAPQPGPFGLTAGADGAIWFAAADRIGRFAL